MNKRSKIILIIPPSRWKDHRYSLGIMYIASYLQLHGYSSSIIDDALMQQSTYNQENALRSIAIKVEQDQPDIVGITCLVNEIEETIRLSNAIKQISPRTKIIVGGTQAFNTPEIFLRNDIDYVVRGEGEATTLELIQSIYEDNDVGAVKGIAWRNTDTIVYNDPRPPIEDLDSIPYPSYHLVNMKKHTSIHTWVIRGLPFKTGMVMTSRGCPYSCSFCQCNAIFGSKIRFRSAENIYAEIKLLRDQYDAEAIWFVDDTLAVNKRHLSEICAIMKELQIWWSCQARIDTVDDKTVSMMRKSGCIQIDFGVESGSNRILREIINKRITVDQTKRAFAACRNQKMRTLANLMIGFPTETKKEMYSTLKLGKEINANSYVLSIATPLPNTKLWDMVNPDITDDELYKLNFFDSELLDKFNKSEVSDLVALREKFLKELNSNQFFRKKLSTLKWYIRIFFSTRWRKQYLSYFIYLLKYYFKTMVTYLDDQHNTNFVNRFSKLKYYWYDSSFLNLIRRIVSIFSVRTKYKFGTGKNVHVKLHLGCGDQHFDGYVNIDWRKTSATDLVLDITRLPYPDNSIEQIESYHVIEHLPRHNVERALGDWYRVLHPGGKLILEYPDFDEIAKLYLAGDEKQLDGIFGLQRFEGDYHLFGYNRTRLSRILKSVGFTNIENKPPQDYHSIDWSCLRVECTKNE